MEELWVSNFKQRGVGHEPHCFVLQRISIVEIRGMWAHPVRQNPEIDKAVERHKLNVVLCHVSSKRIFLITSKLKFILLYQKSFHIVPFDL